MKKIILITMIAVLALTATSCRKGGGREQSAPESSIPEVSLPQPEPDRTTPDGAMSELLQSARDWDVETVEGYLPNGITVSQYVPAAYEASMKKVLARMEYTAGEPVITGDTATVEMQITSVDMSSAMGDATGAAIAYVAKQKLAGQPVNDYSAIAQAVIDAIDIDKLPTKSFSATAHMIQGGDGDWKLDLSDGANMPLLNAVSGGSVELAKQLKDMAADYGVDISGLK